MNTLDWIFLAIIGLLAIRCFMRGFVEEILSVASFAVGGLSALLFYRPGAAFIKAQFGIATLGEIIAFVAIFLVAFLIVKIIERIVHQGVEAAKLDTVDRILGLALGLVEGILLVSAILVFMKLVQPLLKSFADIAGLLEGSFFARTILPIVGPEVTKALSPLLNAPAAKKP
jgi:membrane protein required for colicin V production